MALDDGVMSGYSLRRRIGICLAGALLLFPSFATAGPTPRATADLPPLALTCYGEVAVRQADRPAAPKTIYNDHVRLRLSGGEARIQLPLGFRSNAGDNGWYRIKYLKASDADIIGNAIVSFIDKPFFRVDRLSGRIDVSGLSGSFVGECRKAEH